MPAYVIVPRRCLTFTAQRGRRRSPGSALPSSRGGKLSVLEGAWIYPQLACSRGSSVTMRM
jgi:hypothetical protein